MKTTDLNISSGLKDALQEQGFRELFPPQAEAIPIALEGRNLVAAVPTASGKSLIGFIPAMNMVLSTGKKVLYIVPLKALASEKRDDLLRFSGLGFKVVMSSGDLDSDEDIRDADIVIATSEKADSMIRHGSRWMDSVGMLIADEVHMIHDVSRGPTLEVTLTKFLRKKNVQIIALSATVSNAEDLADWLDAKLVKSDWRPIPLKEGVFYNGEITFDDAESRDVESGKDSVLALLKQTMEDGGQCMIFVNTRRSTESLAVKYSTTTKKYIDHQPDERDLAMLEGGAESTAIGKKLSLCVSSGIAFHNAGLTYKQRRYVEDGFKSGDIKCIVATPTLAAGINLPARRVIVRDTNRFEANSGYYPIPVMEVKQMCGRAGRPGYDPYGEAVLVAKSYDDYEHLMNDYVLRDTERLTSRLGNETILRSHILGLIATGDADSEDGVIGFMRDTFYGSVSELYGIESVVSNVSDFLEKEGMILRDGDHLKILPFGKRVSDLYIDPKSAVILRDAVNNMTPDTEDLPILMAVASTPDVIGLYPKKCDEERLNAVALKYDGEFLNEQGDDEDEMLFDTFMSDLKTAVLLEDWINEVSEEGMTDGMGIGPGDIRTRVDLSDWILYSMNEIAFIYRPEATKRIKRLLIRVRYGIKDELIDLITLRGVGRTRARILYNRGFKERMDLASADTDELSKISGIGPALAKSIKDQIGGGVIKEYAIPPSADEEENDMDAMAASYGQDTQADQNKQSSLLDFGKG